MAAVLFLFAPAGFRHAMVKQAKFFRKQAEKAERMAQSVSDVEVAQDLSKLAKAYRSQAEVLKSKRKSKKRPAG
jgi:hypothetical protein